VVLDDAQAIAVTLWTVHMHIVDALGVTPSLAITSAEKESGKTQLLEVLELLVARPWLTGSVTAATLARKIDAHRPTLLLDESDAAFNGDKEYAEMLRGVLNSGFRSSGSYSRCVGNGAALEVQAFSTFCAKAIAGIGKLPDTAASRSIPIRLRRKAPGETVERKRERAVRAEAAPLRELIAECAAEIEETVATFDLAEMHELPDRAMDIWEPLLSIARLAGDTWFGRAQKAAIALSGRTAQDDESTGVRLLADIRSIFDQHDVGQLFSATVVSGLHEIEDASWAEWHGKPISKNAIARILKRYEIHPTKLRIADSTANGYHRHDFEDTWKRYLPSLPPSATGTSGTTASESQKQAISNRNTEADVPVAELASNPHEYWDVPVVPDEKGGKGRQSRALIGDEDYLEFLFAAFENGYITADEWHEGERAHRFVRAAA
jgi:Protein of unknown function (DUF3631)